MMNSSFFIIINFRFIELSCFLFLRESGELCFGLLMAGIGGFLEPLFRRRVVDAEIHHPRLIHGLCMVLIGGSDEVGGGGLAVVAVVVAVAVEESQLVVAFCATVAGGKGEFVLGGVVVKGAHSLLALCHQFGLGILQHARQEFYEVLQ